MPPFGVLSMVPLKNPPMEPLVANGTNGVIGGNVGINGITNSTVGGNVGFNGINGITNGTIGRTLNDIGLPLVKP